MPPNKPTTRIARADKILIEKRLNERCSRVRVNRVAVGIYRLHWPQAIDGKARVGRLPLTVYKSLDIFL
jgi:hypothetical protein